jgi:hypothetical protein
VHPPGADFGPPQDLGPAVNTGVVSGIWLSPDGTTLYFDSNRDGGQGQFSSTTSPVSAPTLI